MEQRRIDNLTWGAMGLLALIWGGSFLSIHVALADLGALTLVGFRVGGAALVLWVLALALGWKVPTSARAWGDFAVMGFLNNALPFSLIAFGQKTVPSGLTSILNASTAVFGVLVAALFLADERLSPTRLLGVLAGFAGVITAIGLRNLASLDLASVSQLAILCASLSYAISGPFARIRLAGIPPQVAALGMLTASSLLIWPLALVVEGVPTFTYAAATWKALGYLACIATALAYLLLYFALPRAGAGNTSLITLLVAPVAIVLGAVALGERLPSHAYIGFMLLALGLLLVDGRLLPWLARRIGGSEKTG